MATRSRTPSLPDLLKKKIYKTGQTRGADDDVIFQNRVGRNSTALIPYRHLSSCGPGTQYENGFIVLISPSDYFDNPVIDLHLAQQGLQLGKNALVFYDTRKSWDLYNPDELGWKPASSRTDPLGGNYVARVSATTANENSEKINRGFTNTFLKGAGIRVYEYASTQIIDDCRHQLEALFWLCKDSKNVAIANGMTENAANERKTKNLDDCQSKSLLDLKKLTDARMLNLQGNTICPLCLEELSGQGFFNRMAQAEGREVPDLTATQLNLFHIEELRVGRLNHRPYNLGWGHHHCNAVVKDSGIDETLEWMGAVVQRNIDAGFLTEINKFKP
jgi:hypothetical protein